MLDSIKREPRITGVPALPDKEDEEGI